MRFSVFGLVTLGVVLPVLLALSSCGGSNGDNGGPGGDGGVGSDVPTFGMDQGSGDGGGPVTFMDASFQAPDCPGCTFPPMNAPMCAGGTPAINVVYPLDNALVPPNMSVISVMWTPFGPPFTEFEVDFENSVTDMRVVTKCTAQTMDTEQPSQASGGCELQLDPNMWKFVSSQNRGADPVTITVRGTTDGTCANTSANQTHLSFGLNDMLGAIYYWKSTVTANGVGGQIWVKSFGDTNPETLVTNQLMATCNGCHALSRDGQRMAINSDDDDSDDEYGDIGASLIDMTSGAVIGGGGGRGRGSMGPGFASFNPDHSQFLISNGLGASSPPANVFFEYDGNTDMQLSTVTVAGSTSVTMPDWSADGKTVVFVVPQVVGNWDFLRNDDDHVFGASLFTMPNTGGGAFGGATPLLMSGGENNYYPGYSPDGKLVVFDRAPQDTSVPTVDGCTGTAPMRFCPNDSFSNPAARVMLMSAAGGSTVVDLENANGSPAASPVPVSNSWPKWSPFLQGYKGDQLLWIAFSSTRDYGLRVRNHQPGMYQCYPADSFEDPGAAHHQSFQPNCQQPQLWMAAIDVSMAENHGKDPSHVAFWLPFQDITTHNHTPQWTQRVATQDAGGPCVMQGQNCMAMPCCGGLVCQANGLCEPPIQ
jgi:hypothetical protein